ncbi:MAG: hypothetical protein ACRDIB_06555, partial [Ardenticatenaceae bacterium]
MLDALATQMRGASSYVTPDERIDEEVGAFYEKVSTPVLANIALDWGDVLVEELYPSPLPDLFAGQQLVVVGRYREGGPVELTLEGNVNGQSQQVRYDDLRLVTEGETEAGWLPRLWATRKIGTLLQGIRLHGENQEAVAEIIDLAIAYGIVTPYTTFLVDEQQALFSEDARETLLEEAPAEEPMEEVSGEVAVEAAEAAGAMSASDRAVAAPTALPSQQSTGAEAEAPVSAAPLIRTVGARSFVRRDGRWIDTRYEERMELTEIPFGSDSYFELAGRSPEVARYLSVGVPLIVVIGDAAYEVTENDDLSTTGPPGEQVEVRPPAAPRPTDMPGAPALGELDATDELAGTEMSSPAGLLAVVVLAAGAA